MDYAVPEGEDERPRCWSESAYPSLAKEALGGAIETSVGDMGLLHVTNIQGESA